MMMEKSEYIALYDDPYMYDQWDIGPDHERSKFLLRYVLGPRVLELGCGGSGFLRLLVDDYICEAVDINPKWIDLGRVRLPEVKYTFSMVEDFESLHKFSTVIMMEILEHVLDPIVVIQKAFDLLELGGLALVSVPLAGGPWDHTDNHLRQYTAQTLQDDVVKVFKDHHDIWEEGQYVYGILQKAF
jgi:2-polyprenyl-3-methyl-5-hydroxy-6-metoxy-1,4-benzoquinol methylase